MSLDAPDVSHYGGFVTDEAGRVLLRKTAKKGAGYFFRWKKESGKCPDQLVQSSMKAEFGVEVDVLGCDQGVIFINGGTLVNFAMRYIDGDVEAGGLQWLVPSKAWEKVLKIDSHKVLLGDASVLGSAIDWYRDRKRKAIESSMGVTHKVWYSKFNSLCDDVQYLLADCPDLCGGEGVYSAFIQSVINSTRSKTGSIRDCDDLINDSVRCVEKPNRSKAYEVGLIEVIHSLLTEAHKQLEAKNYGRLEALYEKTSECLNLYRELFNGVSPAIRERAIIAGSARGNNRRKLEAIMLEVLVRLGPYRRREQREHIGDKIFEEVLAELAKQNVAQSWSSDKLRIAVRDFLIDNKEAQKSLPF